MRIPTSFMGLPMPIAHSTHFKFLLAVLQSVALLAFLPIISAIPLTTDLDIRAVPASKLPQGWTYAGCISDDLKIPSLTGYQTEQPNMTPTKCMTICEQQSVGEIPVYAGVEGGDNCLCGDVLGQIAQNATEPDCNVPCAGDSTQMCGGPWPTYISLYQSAANIPPPPTLVQQSSAGPWTYLGCYNDSQTNRVLTFPMEVPGGQYNMSVEGCTAACQKQQFRVAGIEYANECWCDYIVNYPGQPMPDRDCRMACSGNQSELCGGPFRSTNYFFTGVLGS